MSDTDPRRRTPAEEARTLVAGERLATLATLSDDGGPWASLVAYGLLADGSPVLHVSMMAEHGRNLAARSRASLCVAGPAGGEDVLTRPRVTLAGVAERRGPAEVAAAFEAAHPAALDHGEFGDFDWYALRVERVRWVGGYARMGSADAADYAAAEPDPVAPAADRAVRHMNDDHADALLLIAQRLGGEPEAERAVCAGADRYGFDLVATTPQGERWTRVAFAEPCTDAGGLRAAAVELTRRARAA